MSWPAVHAVIAKYIGHRLAAYMHTQAWLRANDPLGSHIGIEEIDTKALTYWKSHWGSAQSPHPTAFDWDRLDQTFATSINRFEAAIWHDADLCGMVIGRPSDGNDNVTIHFMERFFGPNPLAGRIAPITFGVADAYAKQLGKKTVKIKNPATGAVLHYKRYGFTVGQPVGLNMYLVRPVT